MSELEFGIAVALMTEAQLIDLLDERESAYLGRSEAAVMRMRGWVLSRLATKGSQDERLLPFIREELEAGNHAYPVAAAALLLRGMPVKGSQWVQLIDSAINRLRLRDDSIQFERYPLDLAARGRTTAVAELETTRRQLPSVGLQLGNVAEFRREVPVESIGFEDHEGRRLSFQDYFLGAPSFVILFYTRCNNPNKCSANVARLGDLAQSLIGEGLVANLAAITYDPAYDTPSRMKAYAEARGLKLGERVRMLRTPENFVEFQRFFEPKVNYSQATVNRHASEAFLLDSGGAIVTELSRVKWDVTGVVERLKALSVNQPISR